MLSYITNVWSLQLKRFLRDWHLAVVILGLLVVDLVVQVLSMSISDLRFTPELVPDSESPPYRDVSAIANIVYC